MANNEITLHSMESLTTLNQWFENSVTDALCISLQPLVIKSQPNIVPMNYFFQKNEHEIFQKSMILQEIIESKNPKNGLSKQACKKLVNDIITTNHEHIISIPG